MVIIVNVNVIVMMVSGFMFHHIRGRSIRTRETDGIGAILLQTLQSKATAKVVAQRLLECLSEFSVEVGVDDGIHSRVEVSDPEEDVHHQFRCVAVGATDGGGDVPDEEGQPAQDEGAHNDAQCFRRFVLTFHLGYRSFGWRG